MELTTLPQTYTQFYGIFFTVLGLGLLINLKNFQKIMADLSKHPSIQLVMALVPLLLGAFLVVQTQTFLANSTHIDYILTAVGSILLLGSIARILAPQLAQKISAYAAKGYATLIVGSSTMLLLGLALLYLGFGLHDMLPQTLTRFF